MAATALSHDQMISAFESRFDYLTARTMLSEVLDSAGVGKSGAYDAAALAKIATAVEKLPRPHRPRRRKPKPNPRPNPRPRPHPPKPHLPKPRLPRPLRPQKLLLTKAPTSPPRRKPRRKRASPRWVGLARCPATL